MHASTSCESDFSFWRYWLATFSFSFRLCFDVVVFIVLADVDKWSWKNPNHFKQNQLFLKQCVFISKQELFPLLWFLKVCENDWYFLLNNYTHNLNLTISLISNFCLSLSSLVLPEAWVPLTTLTNFEHEDPSSSKTPLILFSGNGCSWTIISWTSDIPSSWIGKIHVSIFYEHNVLSKDFIRKGIIFKNSTFEGILNYFLHCCLHFLALHLFFAVFNLSMKD